MHIARKFERLLQAYRRPDGGEEWGGQDLERATGGVVTRSYVSNLRKGRIENPGYDKLAAIARAMGFPPGMWFGDDLVAEEDPALAEEIGPAGRLERLFGAIKNPKTGKPYTTAEVARSSAGDLTEGDVEGIRNGSVADPTVGQVAALAGVFGVEPSYFLTRTQPPFLDAELAEALGDEAVGEIARLAWRLPERERALVLGIVRQFAGDREPGTKGATP